MVYGHEITNTAGQKRFLVEGCSYCRMSTGRQHEPECPYGWGMPVHENKGILIKSESLKVTYDK